MPHAIVKLYPGRSEQQKQALADAVTQAIMTAIGSKAESISVSIEDVAPEEWGEKVYAPEITGKPETLYRKPGYPPPG